MGVLWGKSKEKAGGVTNLLMAHLEGKVIGCVVRLQRHVRGVRNR